MIEKLENARLFSWLEDTRGEMARAEIESMVREFMMDLKGWIREERDYEVVCRGLEHVHIRLQVLDEVVRTTGVTGKKRSGGLVRACRVVVRGGRDPAGSQETGASGMVCSAFG